MLLQNVKNTSFNLFGLNKSYIYADTYWIIYIYTCI